MGALYLDELWWSVWVAVFLWVSTKISVEKLIVEFPVRRC
jgi:hypothetical protein